MKVDSSRSARPTGGARATKRGNGPARGFADEMKEVAGQAGAGEAAAAGPSSAVDALLSVQEAGDATSGGGNARAEAWGLDMIEGLEEIRLGLLTGTIPVARLESLARLVARQRERNLDPRLSQILDDIELRTRVELAKLGRDGN